LNLPRLFRRAVEQENINFSVRGILTEDEHVLPLGTDTKVLSTIFELICRPLIARIATENGYTVEEPPQTIYPDFTLTRSGETRNRIAIDVKTTYRRPQILFTLGSYKSFLRDNIGNILHPYDQYAEHWIIGFVYNRGTDIQNNIVHIDNRHTLRSPYADVEWFVQMKYKIAGDSPGSGNTANIGSIRTNNIQDFIVGNGPFSTLGEETFKEYWANYSKDNFRNIAGFREWLHQRRPKPR